MPKRKVDVVNTHVYPLGDIFADILSDDVVTTADVVRPEAISPVPTPSIKRDELYNQFQSLISPDTALDRSVVSNQANKKLPFYSWFRYKEGFSEPFVDYVLNTVLKQDKPGILLDPFSGAGSSLLAARARRWQTKGIEVLPVGMYATQARLVAERIDVHTFHMAVNSLLNTNFLDYFSQDYELQHIAITKGAFPATEEKQLVGYISYCRTHITDEDIQTLLLYAAFCVLEEMSYTRKDGQYLRWDARSGRSQGKKLFNKGRIYTFREALEDKLKQILNDLEEQYTQPPLFEETPAIKTAHPDTIPELHEGSCLDILPFMESSSIDAVLTSPPYANRYDYTRTYALELVYLGCGEDKVKQLRQNMLSCTVENKDKREKLQGLYEEIGREVDFQYIDNVFQKQEALQEILTILGDYQTQGLLNNSGIVSLIRNYFYEMCFVIHELSRILRPEGTIVIVNDNVRYAGEEVPVDLILSSMAQSFGLSVKRILTLDRGKGNSSQQMGNHGRTELRKCVYVWEKDIAMASSQDKLLVEAHQINYRLRSTFFYRKIKEYNVLSFPSRIANLFPAQELYNWDERANWGIGEDAFTYISKHDQLKLVQVFCHPRLLREYPTLLAYYRNIAALSQKSVGYLVGIDVKKYEANLDNTITLPSQDVFTLARLFNEHITLIIDSSIENFTAEELNALLLTSTGAQIDGAWRNAIGDEAEKVVQRLLVKEAVQRDLLVAFISRVGTEIERYDYEIFEVQLRDIGKYRGIQLSNQTSILFSSEPDITLMGKSGLPWGIIEVKGGTDPAGALERYGAAKKSFENTRKDAPEAKTILIASCMTHEAIERISRDTKTINNFFNLTEVLKEKERYDEFVDLVFAVLDGA